MKKVFSEEELQTLFEIMAQENDVVRLVDPTTQKVHRINTHSSEKLTSCFSIWGRCERCENCSSLRALQHEGRCYKMELNNGRTFLVCSRYLVVNDTGFVMEVVNDISDSMIIESNLSNEVGKMIDGFNHQLITDSLTGVYNRRFMDEYFTSLMTCCRRDGLNVNLAIMDINEFKNINDTYGHSSGDTILKDVASFWNLHFHSRKKGKERLVIRYGGDEFLIIASGLSREAFKARIDRYYRQMRKISYIDEKQQIPFSIAYGIASSCEFDESCQLEALFSLADERMYADKKQSKCHNK